MRKEAYQNPQNKETKQTNTKMTLFRYFIK